MNEITKQPKSKTDYENKEKKLIEKIEKSKLELARLQEKRKVEIGKLAYKCGLNALSNDELEIAFKEIVTKHGH